ncbi:hypothetical protein FSP39_022659 [Pinctada imbricata]|uniref:Endonuclease/exonuclease/phosphatase domain-containing protein n=1 Tax=Pinctada imbricata TaxID=66713 RepID=A0AA88XXU1_PINIB|nr:hypothetical protein FSP39_022659 [Pinctada imbricata]
MLFHIVDGLRIGAFNIQEFGKKKVGNETIMKYLAQIAERYDILSVEEIRDSSGKYHPLEKLSNLVKQTSGKQYSTIVSEPLGKDKEQLGFIYRSEISVVKKAVFDYGKPRYFTRDPFLVQFSKLGTQTKEMVLGSVHTKPDKSVTPKEIANLKFVFQFAEKYFNSQNIILMGDLNAGRNYVKDWSEIPIKNDPHVHWLINDHVDTTVGESGQAYDSETAIVHRLFATRNEIVKKDGTYIKTLYQSEKFNSFTISGNGEFMASNLYTCCVKKFDMEGKTKDFLTVAPYRPCSLWTTEEGHTLVAAIHGNNTGSGLVLDLHERGEMICQTQIIRDQFGRGPMRITQNVNGDFCVITTRNDASPDALKIFDRDWNFKGAFFGVNDQFRPLGLCCDKYGNILLANTDYDEVIMLDPTGGFRQLLMTSEDGVNAPRCLVRSPSGEIWMGCENGDIYVFDY